MDERRTVADDDRDPVEGLGRRAGLGHAERIAAERWGTAGHIGRDVDGPPRGDDGAGRVHVPGHVMDRLVAASSAAIGDTLARPGSSHEPKRGSQRAPRGRSPVARLFGSFRLRGRSRRAQRRLTIVADLPDPAREPTAVPEHAR